MQVLVTGSAGTIGSVAAGLLRAEGHRVVSYDLAEGQDILDRKGLDAALPGCDAVLHCAALIGDRGESDDRILAVNVLGTCKVLGSAAVAGVRRVVFLSSVDALGIFKGESPPDYLPIDDDHPCRPSTPYGVSKKLAEEACRLFTETTGLSVVCLRPPGVWTEETYARIQAARAKRPDFEWNPFWEYGAFIDVRDVATACGRALTAPVGRYACVQIAAPDITTSMFPSRQLAEFVHPDVPWRGGPEYDADPYRSLLVTSRARTLLSWEPHFRWKDFVERSRKESSS